MGFGVKEKGSPAFEEFLEWLGQKVTLKGWTKYSGGLDTTGIILCIHLSLPLPSLSSLLYSFFHSFIHFFSDCQILENRTGTHSIFTEYSGFEIMFHVSTLLPLVPGDEQQVELISSFVCFCIVFFCDKVLLSDSWNENVILGMISSQ